MMAAIAHALGKPARKSPSKKATPMNHNNQLVIIDSRRDTYQGYLDAMAGSKKIFSDCVHLQNFDSALAYLLDNAPQCSIIHHEFDGGDAKSLLLELSRQHRGPDFPIVVSTHAGNERAAVDLMKIGVQDYLVDEEISPSDFMRTLKNAMRTFSLQKQLKQMAHHDSLTGLLNRALFMNRLEQAVSEAKRYERSLSLLSLDVDYFKQINDTYGHDAGDKILRIIAERIRECVRKSDSVARLGGDEFMVLLPNAEAHDGHYVAQKLLKHIPEPIHLDDIVLFIYPSIGLANFPETANDHHELLKQVDSALYKAKEQGRSQYVKFSKLNQNQWQKKLALSKHLPMALQNNEVKLAYQPIFRSDAKSCYCVEALVRWQYEGEAVATDEIVHLIHQGSMAIPYHQWLFSSALSQLALWQKEAPELKMAINMPANLCHNHVIVEHLFKAIKAHNINPKDLILEITETHLMRHADLTKEVLIDLTDKGVMIAIDDFGTGYSSMEYLADLPCSQLKIDQRFFLHWDENPKNKKIVEAITALGHQLGLEVVAEGIANAYLSEIVMQVGCDASQGYWLGKPAFPCPSWYDFMGQVTSANA